MVPRKHKSSELQIKSYRIPVDVVKKLKSLAKSHPKMNESDLVRHALDEFLERKTA